MNSRASNCFRALLAQINHLDSIYQNNHRLKDLYEETSVLAYYMMVDDSKNILSNIQELSEINRELQRDDKGRNRAEVKSICAEIETHLRYLILEYRKCC